MEIKADSGNMRLDLYLSSLIEDMSRNKIKDLISDGEVLVNNELQKPSYIVKKGDIIKIHMKKEETIEAKNMDIEVIYEDDYLALVNKPRDLTVHPHDGINEDTLCNFLLYRFDRLSTVDPKRPGIVHRLDKNTQGILIIAKDNDAHLELKNMFMEHKIFKEYYAVSIGTFREKSGYIKSYIKRDERNKTKMTSSTSDGKLAITHYELISENDKYSFLKVHIETGRTHQIRVHLSSINRPILGDPVYGIKDRIKLDKQVLTAKKLIFEHPVLQKKMEFEVDFDDYFKIALKKCKLK